MHDSRTDFSLNEDFAAECIVSVRLAVKIFNCSVVVKVLICCVRKFVLDLIMLLNFLKLSLIVLKSLLYPVYKGVM